MREDVVDYGESVVGSNTNLWIAGEGFNGRADLNAVAS